MKSAESIESIPQATVEQNPPNPGNLVLAIFNDNTVISLQKSACLFSVTDSAWDNLVLIHPTEALTQT